MWTWVVAGLSAWLLASTVLGVVIGRCIALANGTSQQQRCSPAPVPEVALAGVALRSPPEVAV